MLIWLISNYYHSRAWLPAESGLNYIRSWGIHPMALVFDSNNFYQQTQEHDYKMTNCASWVEHYNFLLGLAINTEQQKAIYKEEMLEYLCYDVWLVLLINQGVDTSPHPCHT